MLSSLDLALASHWSHRVGADGVSTDVRLANGTTIRSQDICGVFNRMSPIPPVAFLTFDKTDREYAQAEMHSLIVSWLASLKCPVVNRSSSHALSGSPLSPARWRVAAGRAGLPTAAVRATTNRRRFPATGMTRVYEAPGVPLMRAAPDPPFLAPSPGTFVEPTGVRGASVLVAGASVWGEGLDLEACSGLADCCRRLALDADVSLLRVHFVSTPDERNWLYCGANAIPDVQEIGPLSALVDLIGGR
jgi:hypothetical protein